MNGKLAKCTPDFPHWSFLLLLFILSFLPRFLWAITHHPPPFSDMEDYYLCAVNFLRGSHLAMSSERLAYRAPLYPLFLVFCMKILPQYGLFAIRLIQSILGSLSVIIVFILLNRLCIDLSHKKEHWFFQFPILPSFVGALFFSWFKGQIFFTSILMTETLFIFTLLVWCFLGTMQNQSKSYRLLCVNSVLLGILALIRPIALIFIPILLFQIFKTVQKNKLKYWIWIPLFAWLIPILPWTIRNALVLHHFVPISTNSGVNFYIGHNPVYDYYSTGNKEGIRQEFEQRYGKNEVLEDRFFLKLGMKYLLENPSSIIPHSLKKLKYLYLNQRIPWPMDEYNRGKGLQFYNDIHWPIFHWNPFFLLPVLLGVFYACLNRLNHGVYLSILSFYTLACVIYFARTRFRLPLEPFFVIYLVLGIAYLTELGNWAFRKSRSYFYESNTT